MRWVTFELATNTKSGSKSENTWNKAHFMVPIFLTYTRKKLDFSDLGSGTADYIAKMWYLRIYFPLQMWFFSDSGMVWYVWDMWYAIMRCILKGFYHESNGSAENWSCPITGSFTLWYYANVAVISIITIIIFLSCIMHLTFWWNLPGRFQRALEYTAFFFSNFFQIFFFNFFLQKFSC